MKKIIAIALLTALAAQGATIISKEGKVVEAEVLSYKDGVFTIRRDGNVHEYLAASLERIIFESDEPEPELTQEPESKPKSNVKVDIKKSSIYNEKGYGEKVYLCPSVNIDFRTTASDYQIRPVVEVLVLVERRTSGSLEVCKMFYAWDKGWERFRFEGRYKTDIPLLSKEQPKCDWKKISPRTLAGRNEKNYELKDGFDKNPKILAHKVCIWLDGEIIATSEQIKTKKPIPKDWTAI